MSGLSSTTTVTRAVVVSFVAGAVALLAACALNPTDGSVKSGPVGALGTQCECTNGQPDCDGPTGGCQGSLRCTAQDLGGENVCTEPCPCPLNFICKAAGIPGERLACFKSP